METTTELTSRPIPRRLPLLATPEPLEQPVTDYSLRARHAAFQERDPLYAPCSSYPHASFALVLPDASQRRPGSDSDVNASEPCRRENFKAIDRDRGICRLKKRSVRHTSNDMGRHHVQRRKLVFLPWRGLCFVITHTSSQGVEND
jgi:hypothetical protein